MQYNIYRIFRVHGDGTLVQPWRRTREGKRDVVNPVFPDFPTLQQASSCLADSGEEGEYVVLRVFKLGKR